MVLSTHAPYGDAGVLLAVYLVPGNASYPLHQFTPPLPRTLSRQARGRSLTTGDRPRMTKHVIYRFLMK